jgi:hypothetical protein
MFEASDGSPPVTGAHLRRELSVWEALGISVALMAPSAAVNINPQATAGTVGRAVPLAFAGEETRTPRRDIPRAILGTAIFGGLYFVLVTAVAMMGFGADDKGVAAFSGSGSLLGDLGSRYVAGWVGGAITIGAAISAFSCALACVVGATRLLFALARDGVGFHHSGRSPRRAGLQSARPRQSSSPCTWLLAPRGSYWAESRSTCSLRPGPSKR